MALASTNGMSGGHSDPLNHRHPATTPSRTCPGSCSALPSRSSTQQITGYGKKCNQLTVDAQGAGIGRKWTGERHSSATAKT